MRLSEAHALYERKLLEDRCKQKTFKNYRSAVRSFIKYVEDIEVTTMGNDYILRWKIGMERDCITQTTIGGYVTNIRMIYKYLRDTLYLEVMDFERMKCPKRDTKPREYIDPSILKQVLMYAKNPRDKAIGAFIFGTGGRVSEVRGVDRAQFEDAKPDEEGMYAVWVIGKGDKYRCLKFNAATRFVVEQYLETRDDYFKPLFISGQHSRITVQRIEQIIADMVARSGVGKHITPHDLRHAFGSDLLINGAPVKSVQELMGHKSATTTLNVYAHVLPKHNSAAHKKYHTSIV